MHDTRTLRERGIPAATTTRNMTAPDRHTEIITEVITFRGLVQGVGFRPTIYRIAQRLGMKGRVRNMGGIVQIVCTGIPEDIDLFVREINHHKPPMAKISHVSRERIGTAVFREFSIAQSGGEEDEIAVIPADIAICDDCRNEFYDPDNPRYLHPFISCTNCGPRYTIMEHLPYDRDATTMDDFPMCDFCTGEYTNPASRRYHAQTISCHDCGPQPLFTGDGGNSGDMKGTTAIQVAIRILSEGGVIALKGVGGYYLVCSPFDDEAVQRIRTIKKREQKPFAVMFQDIGQVREYCVVQPPEETALLSPGRPIVLLEPPPFASPFAPGVNNTSRFIGAFLPSFGLQYLLTGETGPLVMTSANLSDLPLITDDDEMSEMVSREPRIAGILRNRRRITAGLDDSVARMVDGEVQLIRRSKGYVPAPVYVQTADALTKESMIFAAGAHLKSAFGLSKGAYAYLSKHLGDMDSIESEQVYRAAFERMKTFFQIEPSLAVCDLHPRYFPTNFAKGLGLPLIYAQHHHAHIASVMAEHGQRGPVIGVAFDGTGYGTDGAIWGGEILICEGADFERFSHLKYTDIIGGDTSMKDAWKSAVSFLRSPQNETKNETKEEIKTFEIDLSPFAAYSEAYGTLALTHTKEERSDAETAIRLGVNTVRTSSMGRLFDAVCAMLSIHDENRHEGECAILLENEARRALTKRLSGEAETERETLAIAFHEGVASAILEQCRHAREERGICKICLSGGVFQNRILMEETLRLLRGNGFEVYYNIHVPPNDGGIALGQIFIGMAVIEKKSE